MKRRELLTSVGLASCVLAGCTGSRDGESEPGDATDESDSEGGEENNSSSEVTYQECEERFILLSALPDPAKEEATTAYEDGKYETESELVLSKVIDIDDSYLRFSALSDDDRDWYAPVVEEEADVSALRIERERPPSGITPRLDNNTGENVVVEIQVEDREDDEVIIDDVLELAADDSTRLNESVDYRLGGYEANISAKKGAETLVSEGISWNLSLSLADLVIYIEEDGVSKVWAEQKLPICE